MQKKISLFLFILIASVAVVLTGCEKKTEQPQQEEPIVTNEPLPPAVEETKIEFPNLVGTWTGKFDSRATTLTITEQTDSIFKGKITINYREVINQEVSGKINLETKEITMTDLLHSRYKGKYRGKLTDEDMKFSGTFTSDIDKNNFSFSLTKK